MVTKIIITLLLAYIVFLFLRSKNNFFKQSREDLLLKRNHLVNVLNDFNIDLEKDKRWLEAFDTFKNYPSVFTYDGATIVKDLHTIYGYDAPAGNHDLAYIFHKWFSLSGFFKKFVIDYQYGKDMRTLQIPYTTAWSRVFLLWLSTPFWYVFLIVKSLKK